MSVNSISFPRMFNKNKYSLSTGLSYSTQSIHESLTSLFSCNQEELLGDPGWGSEIRKLVFDIKSQPNTYILKRSIADSISKYMKSITTDESLIKIYNNPNDNSYKIVIGYYIVPYDELHAFDIILLSQNLAY